MLSFSVTDFKNRKYTVVSRLLSYRFCESRWTYSKGELWRQKGAYRQPLNAFRKESKLRSQELFDMAIKIGTYEFDCCEGSCSKQRRLLVVFGRCHVPILVWRTASLSGICNGFIQRFHVNDGKISKYTTTATWHVACNSFHQLVRYCTMQFKVRATLLNKLQIYGLFVWEFASPAPS